MTPPITREQMENALLLNTELGHLWTESEIRDNRKLARTIAAAALRADGLTLRKVGEELGVGGARAREIIQRFRRYFNKATSKRAAAWLLESTHL